MTTRLTTAKFLAHFTLELSECVRDVGVRGGCERDGHGGRAGRRGDVPDRGDRERYSGDIVEVF